MGLIKYKFCKFWEVEKEIKINGNANCILVFNQTIILISIGDTLQLYNSENNMNILTFHIHSHDIKDLLKINENIFISSSKDKTIKFTKLEEDYSKFTVIKSIEIHQEEINQTIKLRKDNLFASCSNDNSIKIWQFDFSDDKNNVVVNNSSYHDTKILSICELPNSNIISISEEGFLIFWEYHDNIFEKETILKGFKNSLHNCIFLFKENIILIGTKKAVIFIDIIKKEKIKKIDLQYNAYSIYYFNDAIFLGLKNNWNSCQLIEYELKNNIEEINYGKGCDKCLEISTIYQLNKKKIATCNKNNYIKIWKESESKPKNLFFENNPINYLQDGYESDNEININNTPRNEIQMGIEGNDTPIGENQTPLGENEKPIDDGKIPEGKKEIPLEENKIQKNETPGNKIEINKDINIASRSINNEINNQNNNNDNNSLNYINDGPFNLFSSVVDIVNYNFDITFNLNSGIKMVLTLEKNITVEQMIKTFCEKMNYDNKFIDESITFIHNSKKLGITDKRKLEEVFHEDQIIINVVDPKDILNNNIIHLKTSKGKEYKISISPKENMNNLIKNYLSKTGKQFKDENFDFLKEINFEDFLISLSDLNK